MAPTKQTYQKVPDCIDGKKHDYGQDNKCTKCGYENKLRQYWKKDGQRNERAPKRQDQASKTKVKQSISLLLSGTQSILIGLQPELEVDALSPQEIGALSDVLGDEINESPTLKRWIATAGKQSTHIRLVVILVMIVAPRLARRGLIPAGSESIAAAVAVAAGGASDGDRGDELGEIDFDGGGPVAEAEVPGSDSDKDGPLPPPAPVSSANGHQNGADIGEPKVRSRRTKAKV